MSFESIGLVFGGIGLFLLGMSLMTDGLRFAAGDSLARILHKMTRNRFLGIFTGASMTALVQSSSATTLMTVGLVSAGLISFSNAVGIIFGANIGTTVTSWLVSLIGLKFKVSAFALPLVGIGSIAMLIGKGTWKFVGQAITGFGLLFVGIDFLQSGMSGLTGLFDPTQMHPETFFGRLLLVLVGLLMTVVMQSSSAALASTLTALSTGAITLGAAGALVIGQNVGTTITAMIGAVGGSVPAKRTALAHVMFNAFTGVVAFALLPLFEKFVFEATVSLGGQDPTIQLSAFHTAFNFLGVILLAPFIHQFSRLVERMIPGQKKKFVGGLTPATLTVPAVAVGAVHKALESMLRASTLAMLEHLNGKSSQLEVFETLVQEKAEADAFLMEIARSPLSDEAQAHHIAMMHAEDHLDRLFNVIGSAKFWKQSQRFSHRQEITEALLDALVSASSTGDMDALAAHLKDLSSQVAQIRTKSRAEMLQKVSKGKVMDAEEFDDELRYVLDADRCVYHLWRVANYLAQRPDNEEPVQP